MKKGKEILIYTALLLVVLYLLFIGLVKAKPFLAPLATGMVLAFLMLPASKLFESWGLNRVLSTLSSVLVLLIVTIAFTTVIFFQVKSFTDDWDEIQVRMAEIVEETSIYLSENTPFSGINASSFGVETDEEGAENEENGGGSSSSEQTTEEDNDSQSQAMMVLMGTFGFLTDFLIVFVYVFFVIQFRHKLKEFVLRFFPAEKREEASGIISSSISVSRKYLVGKLLLMLLLAILYYVGLMISGLENALLISLIAAALSIVPVVGNMIGYIIAMAMGLLTEGTGFILAGITGTFIIAQFLDTYVFQPIVLGKKVDVHPFFIILSVVVGYEVWGIIGMVLAIPVFGVLTIICRHVPPLHPFGYLFSNHDPEEPDESI